MNQNDNRPQEVRQGWREDGRVDIDAVRAGTHDVNDSAAVFESLCDEVEKLRSTLARAEQQLTRLDVKPVPPVISFDVLQGLTQIIRGGESR